MSEFSPSSHREILDAVTLAFYGVEFEPVPPDEEGDDNEGVRLLSGSARAKSAYDVHAGSFVEVMQLVSLIEMEGEVVPDHRLMMYWGSKGYEIELDEAYIMDEKEVDAEFIKEEVIYGLAAITDIA